YKALDKAGNIYEKHPLTNVNIVGFKVPKWQEVINLAKKAAQEIPELGIMGWDVAITKEGPLLIEANQYPGHDIYQLPPHTKNGIGMLPTFEKILKID
ncbi:MAG: sugar-transfer associated ATP-grasp domain-containing protein, partial [Bacilli bacterium]|nr:sugar-transfer associated ATP-grasp domain-containing protein [Bacilli bacterium]